MKARSPLSAISKRYSPPPAVTHPNQTDLHTPKSSSSPRTSQTLILPSGRQLSWAEYGKPTGFPLIFLHGFPSSRFEAWTIDAQALKKGIRLICPDRPGFGSSTLRPIQTSSQKFTPLSSLYKLKDYPDDIKVLIDHLNIDKFSILGGSGGGPFALSCGYSNHFPVEKLYAIGMMASAGPWNVRYPSEPINQLDLDLCEGDDRSVKNGKNPEKQLKKDLLWSTYLLYLGVWYFPYITQKFLEIIVGVLKYILNIQWIKNWIDGRIEKSSTSESESPLKNIRENVTKTIFTAFEQGAGGAVHEARLGTDDWGFKLSDIREGVKVKIWHGVKDVNVPLNQIRYMAERIPGCAYKEYDENHFGLVKHLDDILDEMIPSDER